MQHRRSKHDPNSKILTPDSKILFILCYFLLCTVTSTIFGTIGVRPDEELVTNVYRYFHCESNGAAVCDEGKSAYEELMSPVTDIVYHAL